MPKAQAPSKKIRSIKRLLQLPNLSETIRNEKERELAALESEKLQDATAKKIEKMESRYKMVKFVESRKAVKRLKKAEKALSKAKEVLESLPSEASEQERQKATDQVESANQDYRKRSADLVYIEQFPVLEPYISLYKDAEGPGTEKTRQRREEIWRLAEAGTLEKSLPSRGAGRIAPVQEVVEEEDAFFE